MIEGSSVPRAQGAVRVATSRDARAVAALHCTAIDDGFLSSLGDRFLSRLYTRVVASPHAFLLVADHPSPAAKTAPGIAGFVAGSAEIGRLYREFFWRDGLSVVTSSGIRLARSLPQVFETMRYGANKDAGQAKGSQLDRRSPETELLSLAVDGAARRCGVGTALVQAFLTTAHSSGSASARVIVGAQNHRAIALYRRAGFRETAPLEVHSGTESMVMRVGLSGAML